MIHLFFVWGANHTLFPWQQRLSGPVPTAPNRISLLSKCVKWFVCLHVAIISTAEGVRVCACTGRWKEEGFHACNGLTEARWHTYHHSAGLHTSHQPKDSYTRHVELVLHTAYTRPFKIKPKMHAVTWPTDAAGNPSWTALQHTHTLYRLLGKTYPTSAHFSWQRNFLHVRTKKKKKNSWSQQQQWKGLTFIQWKTTTTHTLTHTKKHMSRLHTHKAE